MPAPGAATEHDAAVTPAPAPDAAVTPTPADHPAQAKAADV
jgi:hypothetical protein